MTDTDLREQITKILFGSTDEPNGLAAAIVNEVEALIREQVIADRFEQARLHSRAQIESAPDDR